VRLEALQGFLVRAETSIFHISGMTRLLEQAIETVSALPDDVQDDLARMLLQFAGVEQPPYVLTPEERADIEASLAEAERGEFATDEEVRAVWAKHGLLSAIQGEDP
jgi:hypothetical protein